MWKIKTFIISISLFCAFCVFGASGVEIPLWKDIPSMRRQKSVMYYHASKLFADGEIKNAAVIICPGGSYHHLGLYNEGYTSAEWFADKGLSAFTLRYRTAENGFHEPAMLQDVQRAIQLVRENAEVFGIDKNKVGLIGYSAGGHLVTMAAAFCDSHDELSKLDIQHHESLKPDFVIPVYPVVTMQDEFGHKWSRKSLLGKKYDSAKADKFSMEMQISSGMPPFYIVVCKDDNVVDWRNSCLLYDALQAKGVNAELKVYDWGGHGFGMSNTRFMRAFHWNEEMWQWLKNVIR